MKIWLADLTYTQQTIASDTMPAAVGCIATYTEKLLGSQAVVQVFKYPEDLAAAFEREQPDIIGFSNYMWNFRLSSALARAIKARFPHILIVFGGPNFPTIPHEQEQMLRAHPEIDFYVMKEGEVAFAKLAQVLADAKMDKTQVAEGTPNLAYVDAAGRFHTTLKAERIPNLEDIPSPYLEGKLDHFFDGRLLPIIQTNRGCPFTCTFCTEGQSYWTKVYDKPEHLIRDELVYIAERMNAIPADRRRTDLLIADSNFGMYPSDLTTCRVIAQVQERYGYPKYINVATGKNHKERVLEAAKLVNGAMKLAGSVQSLDPVVMKNIKRQNISAEQIVDMAIHSSEIGANTYSEVILALPGDSKRAHFNTLATLINAEFNTVCMYQLMILPGTEMGTASAKTMYAMQFKYRVVPRCFGYYSFLGERIAVAEIEEICVQNSTLPFEDYLQCRRMNLIVNIFYNEGVFGELLKLLRANGVSPWAWLQRIYTTEYSARFTELQERFLADTKGELWDRKDDLVQATGDSATIDRFISGELGSNLMFKYKALSLTSYIEAVADVARASVREVLEERGTARGWLELSEDIIRYNYLRASDIFAGHVQPKTGVFAYDVRSFSGAKVANDSEEFRFSRPITMEFCHSEDQRSELESYIRIFGNDTRGLTRILSRVYLKKFFRNLDVSRGDPSVGPVTYTQTIMGS